MVIEQMFINFAVNIKSSCCMSRFRTTRKVSEMPVIKGLKPFGHTQESVDDSPVNLLLEEYEAIRLCDYEHLNHYDASIKMEVSRPTFSRIYSSALTKFATAMVEGRSVYIEGGKVCFDSEWYHCETCDTIFNHPDMQLELIFCPLCGSKRFHACADKDNDAVFSKNQHYQCLKCNPNN